MKSQMVRKAIALRLMKLADRLGSVVTKRLAEMGFCCGPILDISYSRQYDIRNHRVFQWIAFMCEDHIGFELF